MKLLVCTQAVDPKDPVLGFFHGWLSELSKHFEHITVICLRAGEHTLPQNVEVVALGGNMRFLRALEVCALAFGRRNEYEAVFVHMGQEFVLASGWLWMLLRKRVYLWRNHYAGSFLTDVAAAFCTNVFCTSKFSYTAKYKKTLLMPVGIDTNAFTSTPGVSRVSHSVLFFGRMVPSKNPELLLEALGELRKQNVEFTATLCGPGDDKYIKELEQKTEDLGIRARVTFLGSVPNTEAPRLFSAHTVYVNTSPPGMFDKTIFEAMACGTLVLSSSPDLEGKIADNFRFSGRDFGELAQKVRQLLSVDERTREEYTATLRRFVVEQHSLSILAEKLREYTQRHNV